VASLLFLLILAALVYAITWAVRHRHENPVGVRQLAPRISAPPGPAPSEPLRVALDEWAGAGLISTDQAAGIVSYEVAKASAVSVASAEAPPTTVAAARVRRVPAVAEALGYLGGVLAAVGGILLVSRYWTDMTTAARLGITAGSAVILLVAGLLVPGRADELVRLRGALWFAATAATAAFAVIAVHFGLGVDDAATVVLAGAGAVVVESGLLWFGRNLPLQQFAFLGGMSAVFGSAAGHLEPALGWAGVAVVLYGTVLGLVGLRRLLPYGVMAETLGAVAALVGTIVVANDWPAAGLLLAVAISLALIAVAVLPGLAPSRRDQLILGILGAFAMLQAAPQAVGHFAAGAAAATGSVTYVAGAAIVAIAARRLVRLPEAVAVAGAAALFGGAATTFGQWHGFAPVLGTVTAVVLIALGTLPRQFELSLLGSAGLLGNVPWLITWFFPGEGRAAVLTLACGAVIIAVAVFLTRMSGRFSTDLAPHHRLRDVARGTR
jgi:hypothetical protein